MVEMNSYMNKLKEIVLTVFEGEDVKIILFGSRARIDYSNISDVDVGIIPYNELNVAKITILKEKIENLNIPYKVDIVNFLEVSDVFREEALKGAIVWKE